MVYSAENSSTMDLIERIDNVFGSYLPSKELQASPVKPFMEFLSDYGREYFWTFTIAILFLCGKREGKLSALLIFVSIIIIIPVNTVLKDVIDKDRPVLAVNESSEAYPSGHASIVTAGVLGSALYFNNTWKKKTVSVLLIIEAFFVCISRIFLGSHYVSDVVGGALLGSFVVLTVSFYTESIYAIYCRIYNRFKRLI